MQGDFNSNFSLSWETFVLDTLISLDLYIYWGHFKFEDLFILVIPLGSDYHAGYRIKIKLIYRLKKDLSLYLQYRTVPSSGSKVGTMLASTSLERLLVIKGYSIAISNLNLQPLSLLYEPWTHLEPAMITKYINCSLKGTDVVYLNTLY